MALTSLTRRRNETVAAEPAARNPRWRTRPGGRQRKDENLEGLTAGALYDLALHGHLGAQKALTGAALEVTAPNAMDVRRLVQPWQARSMSYYDLVPEVKFAARFMGALLSRVRLFPAMLDDETNEAEEITDTSNPVYQAFERIQDRNGERAQLQQSYGTLRFLISEGYLTVSPDKMRGEVWEFLSPNELRVQPGGIATRFRAPMLSADQYQIAPIRSDYIIGNAPETIAKYGEVLNVGTNEEVFGPALTEQGPDVISVWRLWRPHPAYCADTETEILTETGWKRQDALRVGERVMTLNHDTGQSEWQPTRGIARFYVEDEEMVSIEGRSHSSLTTADHRWPILKYERPGLTRRPEWTTSEHLNSNDRIISAALCADIPVDSTFDDAFVEAVAWFYTEGSIAQRYKSAQVTLSQSLTANAPYVEKIRSALTALHGEATMTRMSTGSGALAAPKWREHHRSDGGGGTKVEFWLNTAASAELLEVAPNKVVSLDFIKALTLDQLELFIAVSLAADGHGNQLYQKAPARLDAFELACVLTGRTTTRGVAHPRGVTMHGISITPKRSIHITSCGRRMGPTGKNMCPTRRTYTGIVWCPNTVNGTWLARRKGTIYYTGNSWLADSNMMASLDLLEELVLSTYSVRSQLKSRLYRGGILAMPEEMSFPSVGNNPDEDPNSDLFQERLTSSIMASIGDPGTAAAFSPMVVNMAGEFIKDIKLIRFNDNEGTLAEITQRTEMIERFGVGAELPPELFSSKADLNHWSSWYVDEDTWKSYGDPAAREMASDICAAYLQPAMLEEPGVDWTKVRIGIDPVEVIYHPNRAADATALYQARCISKKVYLEALGYNENDLPPEDELNEQLGVAIKDSSLAVYGIPAVRANIEPAAGEVVGAPDSGVANPATGGPKPPGPPKEKVDKQPGAEQDTPGKQGPGANATNAGPAVTSSAVERTAKVAALAEAGMRRGREMAGARLRSMTTGRHASRCVGCEAAIDGLPNWDVAHTLGEQEIVGLFGPITHTLVDGTGHWVAAALEAAGVSRQWAVDIGALVEQHTAGTLFSEVPAGFPPGFERLLARVDLPRDQTTG